MSIIRMCCSSFFYYNNLLRVICASRDLTREFLRRVNPRDFQSISTVARPADDLLLSELNNGVSMTV